MKKKSNANRPKLIKEAIKAGKAANDIMKAFGVSKHTVAYHKTQLNKAARKGGAKGASAKQSSGSALVLTEAQWAIVRSYTEAKKAGRKVVVQI